MPSPIPVLMILTLTGAFALPPTSSQGNEHYALADTVNHVPLPPVDSVHMTDKLADYAGNWEENARKAPEVTPNDEGSKASRTKRTEIEELRVIREPQSGDHFRRGELLDGHDDQFRGRNLRIYGRGRQSDRYHRKQEDEQAAIRRQQKQKQGGEDKRNRKFPPPN